MTKKIPKKNERPGVDKYGRTPFLNSVINNDLVLANNLIKNGADINVVDDNHYSALHFASQNYSKEMIKLLLDNGAEVNKKDNYGNNKLMPCGA